MALRYTFGGIFGWKGTVGVSTPGVPGPTSKLSLRAPVQIGWRETGHEGGKPRLRVILRQSGCACSRGLQAFARE
jgi:hypothetical protein